MSSASPSRRRRAAVTTGSSRSRRVHISTGGYFALASFGLPSVASVLQKDCSGCLMRGTKQAMKPLAAALAGVRKRTTRTRLCVSSTSPITIKGILRIRIEPLRASYAPQQQQLGPGAVRHATRPPPRPRQIHEVRRIDPVHEVPELRGDRRLSK